MGARRAQLSKLAGAGLTSEVRLGEEHEPLVAAQQPWGSIRAASNPLHTHDKLQWHARHSRMCLLRPLAAPLASWRSCRANCRVHSTQNFPTLYCLQPSLGHKAMHSRSWHLMPTTELLLPGRSRPLQ